MAHFVRHEPCEKCGSRDNKGVYSDGSAWCFGCGSYFNGSFLEKISESGSSNPDTPHKPLPPDADTHYGPGAVTWFTKYGMDLHKLIKHGVKYSHSRNQIIFTWPDIPLWQARNLDTEYRDKDGEMRKLSKYYTSGDHSHSLPVYTENPLGFWEENLVITEDALSALKIASGRAQIGHAFDAMPLLGTHLPTNKLMALKGYKSISIWLDHDKYKESIKICNKFRAVGTYARAIYTPKDPKEYSYEEIQKILRM